jgi:hypothetical protein
MKMLKLFIAAALAVQSFVMDKAQKVKSLVAPVAVGVAGFGMQAAHAQTVSTNPIVVLLQSITLSEVAVAIAAIALIIVAIALTMKGPDVSKRVIRKV